MEPINPRARIRISVDFKLKNMFILFISIWLKIHAVKLNIQFNFIDDPKSQFSILNWVRTPLFCPCIIIMWLEREFLFLSILWQIWHWRVGVAVCKVSMWRIALLLLAKSLRQRRQRQELFRSVGSTWTKFSSSKPKYQTFILLFTQLKLKEHVLIWSIFRTPTCYLLQIPWTVLRWA